MKTNEEPDNSKEDQINNKMQKMQKMQKNGGYETEILF